MRKERILSQGVNKYTAMLSLGETGAHRHERLDEAESGYIASEETVVRFVKHEKDYRHGED